MKYSKIKAEHTENMSKIMHEIGYKEAKKLLEEIYCLGKFNSEKFDHPNKLVKRLQKTFFDFDKTHFDYFVDVYNAKENPEYYNFDRFSEAWFEFIKKKISDPLVWIEEKIKCNFHGGSTSVELIKRFINEEKKRYMKEKEVSEKVKTSCVYFFKLFLENDTLYKIGKTDSLERRMQVLKKEYRDNLFLVNAINCESSQHAFFLERKIHSEWVEKRRFVKRTNGTTSNEWFALDEYDLMEIAKKYKAVIN